MIFLHLEFFTKRVLVTVATLSMSLAGLLLRLSGWLLSVSESL